MSWTTTSRCPPHMGFPTRLHIAHTVDRHVLTLAASHSLARALSSLCTPSRSDVPSDCLLSIRFPALFPALPVPPLIAATPVPSEIHWAHSPSSSLPWISLPYSATSTHCRAHNTHSMRFPTRTGIWIRANGSMGVLARPRGEVKDYSKIGFPASQGLCCKHQHMEHSAVIHRSTPSCSCCYTAAIFIRYKLSKYLLGLAMFRVTPSYPCHLR